MMNLEKKILEFFYNKFLSDTYYILTPTTDLIKSLNLGKEIDHIYFHREFESLMEKHLIRKRKGFIEITLTGIQYYEKKYLNSNYYIVKAIIIILEFLIKLEKGDYKGNKNVIQNEEVIKKLLDNGIEFNNKRIYSFIVFLEQNSNLFKNLGPFGIMTKDHISSIDPNKPIVTSAGFRFLKKFRRRQEESKKKITFINGEIWKMGSELIQNSKFKYDFALSFAGEDRDIVEDIAKKLVKKEIRVFYDKFKKADLWGKDLSDYFKKTYGERSKYVVIFVSKHYEVKVWTNFEFDIARGEAKKRTEEFILPIKLDDTILFGLKSTRAILDYREEGIQKIVELMLEKLKLSNYVKEDNKKNEKSSIVLNIIEEILLDIHTYQNMPEMNETILEKIINLDYNFKEELKSIYVFIEKIGGKKTLAIYLKDEKIIAKPGRRISRISEDRTIFLQNYEEIKNLINEIRKRL